MKRMNDCAQPVFIRDPYNYDRGAASDYFALRCLDPSLAVQSAKEECDINTIVRRFGLTGVLPDNVSVPQYGDFSAVDDYQSSLNAVVEADREFMRLPAELRKRFGNSPQVLLEFVADKANLEEARSLGLVAPLPIADVSTIVPTK